MDVAGIDPGADFRKVIEDNVVTCGVLLAVIGPSWVGIKNAAGTPRLEDPSDFVRIEIASALKRNVAVIPVLVHDAKMPHPESLPDDLKDLCYRNSVELTHARWNSDVALLTKALKPYVVSTPASEQEPVHATVSVQLPPPHPAQETPPGALKKSISPVVQGAGVALFLVLAVGAYFAVHHKTPGSVPDRQASSTGRRLAGLEGRWVVPVANRGSGDSLASLEITDNGGGVIMHAFGTCTTNNCDWGAHPARFDGSTVTASFGFPIEFARTGIRRTAAVTISSDSNGAHALVHNTYKSQGNEHSIDVQLPLVAGPDNAHF